MRRRAMSWLKSMSWLRRASLLLIVAAALGLSPDGRSAGPPPSGLVQALRAELTRSMALQLPGAAKPYYLSYLVREVETLVVGGEFGGVVSSTLTRRRIVSPDLRVGSHKLDNSQYLGRNFFSGLLRRNVALPLEDEPHALRWPTWMATDSAYKHAVELLEKKRADLTRRPRDLDHPGDYTPAKPVQLTLGAPAAPMDRKGAEALIRRLTGLYWQHPTILEGNIGLVETRLKRTLVTSEGTVVEESSRVVSLSLKATAQADDGMVLEQRDVVVAPTQGELPAPELLERRVRDRLAELLRRRSAPAAEDYSGPVLFEGRAAAQLLRRLLVPHLCGTPSPSGPMSRLIKDTHFAGKRGRQVLAPELSVVDDPGLQAHGKVPLVGGYRIDDEGVAARRVSLVQRGKLKALLMSRTPRKELTRSTGHGRQSLVGGARGSISNLVVSARRGLARKALVRKLLARAKRAGEGYAIIVRGMAAGRAGPFGLRPGAKVGLMEVIKVTPDGKEQPVRGLELVLPPVTALKRVAAAGREGTVHSVASATFGGLVITAPTSVVTPALLLETVDLRKVKGKRRRKPLVPRPKKGS